MCRDYISVTVCPDDIGVTVCHDYISVTMCPDDIGVTVCRDYTSVTMCPDDFGVTVCHDHISVTMCPDDISVTVFRDCISVIIYVVIIAMSLRALIVMTTSVSLCRNTVCNDYTLVTIYHNVVCRYCVFHGLH